MYVSKYLYLERISVSQEGVFLTITLTRPLQGTLKSEKKSTISSSSEQAHADQLDFLDELKN